MNRLRKARPGKPSTTAPQTASTANGTIIMSRTMQLAVGGAKTSSSPGNALCSVANSASLQKRSTWYSTPPITAPRTNVEQYWATRALVAETLLTARDLHQGDLAEMRRMEELKREQEVGAILRANDQRQKRLELSMMACLAVMLVTIGWLAMNITPDQGRSGKPPHFTIPILSPFTSVVEHETGVFGAKAVAIFVLAMGVATYVALKHWLSQWRMR